MRAEYQLRKQTQSYETLIITCLLILECTLYFKHKTLKWQKSLSQNILSCFATGSQCSYLPTLPIMQTQLLQN